MTVIVFSASALSSATRALGFVSPEPGVWRGETQFRAVAGGVRIVLVKISAALDARERLAVLGHELQHVREIADAPEVVDQAGLANARQPKCFLSFLAPL